MNVIPSGFRNYFNLHLYDIPGAGIKQEFLSKKKKKNKPDFYVSQTEFRVYLLSNTKTNYK